MNGFKPVKKIIAFIAAVLCLSTVLYLGCQLPSGEVDWRIYKSDSQSSSYSELDQINKGNVSRLEVAWIYRTGDLKEGNYSTIETNPVIVGNILYGASPLLNVFALDARTGKELWMYKPFPEDPPRGYMRSLTYWEDGADKRILFSAGTWLFALNAVTGEIIDSFGEQGRVDLNKGLGRDPNTVSVKAPSPGIIYKDLIIMGSAVGESYDSAPGHIRAYNVRTGEMVWIFHTIPQPGEPGYETWERGGASGESARGGVNNWAGMSLDQRRGIVYVPLGSPTYDFYGGDRPGSNLYGNSLLALDAATGQYIWHYQTVHHDLWDYDLPAPPNLLTINRNGRRVDAVAQVTKSGFTFVFDRETGEPLFDIVERPVPVSHISTEQVWPSQPHPVAPEPFIRQHFTREEITNISSEAYDSVAAQFSKHRNEGLFTPPDLEGAIFFPGTSGGANWGGAAHDPGSGILYINANEIPEFSTLHRIEREIPVQGTLFDRGQTFYKQNCASCHGDNLEGQHPNYPALNDIKVRSSREDVLTLIEEGGGRMPAFASIPRKEKDAIVAFLFDERDAVYEERAVNEKEVINGNKRFINVTAYRTFKDPGGYPAIKPPWGTLNAIDLNTGKIKWKVPLGIYPELIEKGLPPTGSENYGGPIVTAGGVVFIGATKDKKLRAFDKDTGELLWEATLPTGGFATPATYMAEHKQYVVIAAGGGRGTSPGDYYIAFALPGTGE